MVAARSRKPSGVSGLEFAGFAPRNINPTKLTKIVTGKREDTRRQCSAWRAVASHAPLRAPQQYPCLVASAN
ncbi:hypothetical protein EJB05_40137, partial [Eragrostis curvula]